MDKNEQNFINQIRSGNVDFSELEATSSNSLTSPVTLSDLGVCYSSTTGQLSAYCTVTCNNSGDNITGIGLVVYKANSSTMYCLQYSNGMSGSSIATSVGTNLYTTSMGNQVLCIVYGWTQNSGNYYISSNLTVGAC
jgi:hypothetical protein